MHGHFWLVIVRLLASSSNFLVFPFSLRLRSSSSPSRSFCVFTTHLLFICVPAKMCAVVLCACLKNLHQCYSVSMAFCSWLLYAAASVWDPSWYFWLLAGGGPRILPSRLSVMGGQVPLISPTPSRAEVASLCMPPWGLLWDRCYDVDPRVECSIEWNRKYLKEAIGVDVFIPQIE